MAGSLMVMLEAFLLRLVEGHARRRKSMVIDNEVVEVHGLALSKVLLRRLAQLRNATGSIERSSGLAMLLLLFRLSA
jgi:hypothetical protein